MAAPNMEELLVDGVLGEAARKDPIERLIIKHLMRLRHQNKRLRDHIDKTGAWAHLKDVNLWKPFDFFHYFCNRFQEKYGREYSQAGNVVRAYHRIDEFRVENKITREEYKEFIDLAFDKYFTNVSSPSIAHICSHKLFNHLMDDDLKFTTASAYHTLDHALAEENAEFEQYVRDQ